GVTPVLVNWHINGTAGADILVNTILNDGSDIAASETGHKTGGTAGPQHESG
ncbi:unnamed protein product, partial [marine sediment metagenome]